MSFITKRTRIDLIELKDIEDVRILHNEESVLFQLSDTTFITPEMQKLWFVNLMKSSNSFRYVCRSLENNDLIGVFRVDNFDMINKSAMIGLDVAIEFRRKGFAFEIYEFLIGYFLHTKKLHRLYLSTLETNLAAQALYAKLGFSIEGVQKEAIWRNGNYINLINFSLISAL